VGLNPLIQADMNVGRDFKFKQRFTFRLQMPVFNVFINTRSANLDGVSRRRPPWVTTVELIQIRGVSR
jgi:hypothetical protein